jgi:hypothetical protein
MQYYVSFNGHLVESRRPDGWPRVVRDKFVYQCDTGEQLASYLNEKAKDIQNRGGMHINFTKKEAEELRGDEMSTDQSFGYGCFVPMSMFTHIDYTVRFMAGEFPAMGSEKEDKGLIH